MACSWDGGDCDGGKVRRRRAESVLTFEKNLHPHTVLEFSLTGIGDNAYISPATVDIDSDGDLDLVLGTKETGLIFYENAGSARSPSFVARTGLENPFANVMSAAVYDSYNDLTPGPTFADLDGDGDKDLVLGGNGGICRSTGGVQLWYFENKKNDDAASYAQASAAAFDGLYNPDTDSHRHEVWGMEVGAAFADVDGDGDVDLLLPPFFGAMFERKGACWEHTIHLDSNG